MKKILLATSILVGTAGVAAADVSISGGARFGVMMNTAGVWSLTNRFTLNFDGSGETDGGLAYGGRVRLRASNFGAAALSGANAWIESNGLRLSVGNVNGAIEMMPGLYSNGVGLTGLGWNGVWVNHNTSMWGWQAFSSSGPGDQGIAIDYSSGDFGVHASYDVTQTLSAVSASYSFGNWTVAGGIQEDAAGATMQDFVVIGVTGSLGDFGVNAAYASFNAGAAYKWTIGGKYSMNDISVNAFYSGEDGGVSSYGIGAAYDLGGATIAGGVARLSTAAGPVADLGIRISF